MGFLTVLRDTLFKQKKQQHAGRRIGYAKLPLVCECVYEHGYEWSGVNACSVPEIHRDPIKCFLGSN